MGSEMCIRDRIKAHVGHVGNEAADQLAKQGTVSEKSIKLGFRTVR